MAKKPQKQMPARRQGGRLKLIPRRQQGGALDSLKNEAFLQNLEDPEFRRAVLGKRADIPDHDFYPLYGRRHMEQIYPQVDYFPEDAQEVLRSTGQLDSPLAIRKSLIDSFGKRLQKYTDLGSESPIDDAVAEERDYMNQVYAIMPKFHRQRIDSYPNPAKITPEDEARIYGGSSRVPSKATGGEVIPRRQPGGTLDQQDVQSNALNTLMNRRGFVRSWDVNDPERTKLHWLMYHHGWNEPRLTIEEYNNLIPKVDSAVTDYWTQRHMAPDGLFGGSYKKRQAMYAEQRAAAAAKAREAAEERWNRIQANPEQKALIDSLQSYISQGMSTGEILQRLPKLADMDYIK